MQQPIFRKFAVLALAVVAACSGGGADAAPGPTAGPAPENGTSTTTAEPGEESAGSEAQTLADFLAGGDAEVDFRDQEARIQEAIRVCMAEQGFDYIPVVPPDDAFEVWDETDEEERVRTYGFGITTWVGDEDPTRWATDAPGAAMATSGGTEWVDPNQAKHEAMSESEQQAWSEALYGTEEEQQANQIERVDEETGETYIEMTGNGAGCSGEAYGGNEVDEMWEQLGPAFDSMYERIEADPRIVEAHREWSACMAAAGYDGLASRDAIWEDVHQDFQQRLEAIVDVEQTDPFAGWSQAEIDSFFAEKTQEEIDAFFAQAQQEAMANVDQEALAALQQEEIAMAVANWECEQDLNDLYTEISAEYENSLIAENRALLEQIRDSQGG